MPLIEYLYAVSSVLLALTGLTMVGFAIRAYQETQNRPLIHLAIGFVFVVAATLVTVISAFLTDFHSARSILFVQSNISTIGFIFILYSLITY